MNNKRETVRVDEVIKYAEKIRIRFIILKATWENITEKPKRINLGIERTVAKSEDLDALCFIGVLTPF